jgi:ubiquinone/menaquinone biosynthesis C-methylase UbiE
MIFDYNQSIWGKDTANLSPTHPTAFRLRQALINLRPLKSGARILEIGCGAGQFIKAIKQHLPSSECYGFDISETAIKLAQSRDSSVNYLSGSGARWPLADNFFDAVVIFDVLEHVESVEQTMLEIQRILKPGGLVYAFIPCEGDYLSLWHSLRFSKRFDRLTALYAGHINRHSRSKWEELIRHFGFKIMDKKYSEHVLGQIIGVLSFYLMDRNAKKRKLSQLNNEEYFDQLNQKTKFKKVINFLRVLINSLIYLESVILQNFPSPNLHIVLKKPN